MGYPRLLMDVAAELHIPVGQDWKWMVPAERLGDSMRVDTRARAAKALTMLERAVRPPACAAPAGSRNDLDGGTRWRVTEQCGRAAPPPEQLEERDRTPGAPPPPRAARREGRLADRHLEGTVAHHGEPPLVADRDPDSGAGLGG